MLDFIELYLLVGITISVLFLIYYKDDIVIPSFYYWTIFLWPIWAAIMVVIGIWIGIQFLKYKLGGG